MDNESAAWIFLNHIPNLGPMRFHRLLHAARSAGAILELDASGLTAAGVSIETAERWHKAFRDDALRKEADGEIGLAQKGRLGIVTELDAEYPVRLKELVDRPPVLYYQGNWPDALLPHIAVVGTRHPTGYGIGIAEKFTRDLIKRNCVTVSGLARGIDTCVHVETLAEKGITIAVLGNGLSQNFPRENFRLQKEISEKGLVLSEFPVKTMPDPRHFPRRNRIISGLSQGVIVVDAGDRSGALITARYAAEQGREVFAVPHALGSPGAPGCHRLLRQGAKLVETADDILEEWSLSLIRKEPQGHVEAELPVMDAEERVIFDKLGPEGESIDELVEKLGLPVDRIGCHLLNLELKGLIRSYSGQRYAKI
jgi:DNA processing protein